MAAISIIGCAKNDPCPALLAGLEYEFGTGEIHSLATRFLEGETADFHWNARMNERHLGIYESLDEGDCELDRVGVIGWIGGHWYVATCIVDGDGAVHDIMGLQRFESEGHAEGAFDTMR